MRKSILAGVGLLALAGATAGTVAAQSAPTAWLHVRVDEVRDNTKVSVNLPLSVVEAVLKASPEILEKHGRVHIGKHHGLELADLRRVWKELAAVGDAELVSVESDDENVKVQRKGDVVQVFVHPRFQLSNMKRQIDRLKNATASRRRLRVAMMIFLADAFNLQACGFCQL